MGKRYMFDVVITKPDCTITVFAPWGSMEELCGEIFINAENVRYHFFFDPQSLTRTQATLYKNPPRGIGFREPGYFDTRRLNPRAAANRKMIDKVLTVVREQNIVQQIVDKMHVHQHQLERTAYVVSQVRTYWLASLRREEPPVLSDISDDEFNAESLRLAAYLEKL